LRTRQSTQQSLGPAARRSYHRVMSTPASDIEKLAPEERLRLIEELWESLRAQPESVPLTEPQRDLLDRRLDELDSGEATVITWAEAKRRLCRR